MSHTMTQDAIAHTCQCLTCTHARREASYDLDLPVYPSQVDNADRCTECNAGLFYSHDPNCSRRKLTLDAVGAEDTEALAPRLTEDSAERKRIPLATGLLDYFPDALAAVAEMSVAGNEKHVPGEPLTWHREASADHADCLLRHLLDRGTVDSKGRRHSVAVAWRALALLQLELEAERGLPVSRGSL